MKNIHRKENTLDNVSRHQPRNKEKEHQLNRAASDSIVKKGYDKNAFLIDKDLQKKVEEFTIHPKSYILNYYNNEAIINISRESIDILLTQKDLISVIIPTYNRFESLNKAIESIKQQTYKNVEIIVINDASTQKDYYNKSLGDNIQLINLPINMKEKYQVQSAQGLTRNEGIKIAKGKYITFLDDDDYWFPEKLQIQLYYLKKHKLQICSTNYFRGHGIFNENNKMKYNKGLCCDLNKIHKIGKYEGILTVPDFKYSLTSTVLIKKSFLNEMNCFKLIDAEDWDLWNRIYKIEKTLFIDILLIYYDLGHAGGKHYKVGNNWQGKDI